MILITVIFPNEATVLPILSARLIVCTVLSSTDRNIFLIIYHLPLFPAHWALYVPSEEDKDIGKLIQVDGDALKGFEIEFERNHDLCESNRSRKVIALPIVSGRFVTDVKKDGSFSRDQIPYDKIEEIAWSIPAPGPSLVKPTPEVCLHTRDKPRCFV